MLQTRTASEWTRILAKCGVAAPTAARWAPAFSEQLRGTALSAGEAELDDFLGQVLHECAYLERLSENLNYKTDALIQKFGRHRISTADAMRYGRIDGKQIADQRSIANCIYGGEFGRTQLGNTQPGDGWTYRGRGPIQVTGRSNYMVLGDAIDADLLTRPELLSNDPYVGLAATIRWWERTLPDSLMGNLVAVTKRVNGGTNGLDDRAKITEAAQRALAA